MSIASPITAAALAATLRAGIDGDVVTPDDPSFGAAGFGFSAAARRRAEAIVIAARGSDVAAAVRIAARAGRRVAVQVPGRAAGDGEVLIVTRLLAGVSVDPLTRTATVGVAAGWTQVLDAAEPHGLFAAAAGSEFDGAGRPAPGRLPRFAPSSVMALQVATVTGDLVWVEAADDPDLFDRLRVGGGSLGFVTAMTIDLLPLPSLMAGELWVADGPAAVQAWRDWAAALGANVSTSVSFGAVDGRNAMRVRFAHVGDPAAGARLLAALQGITDALQVTVTETPWSTVTAGLRTAALSGERRAGQPETVPADRVPAGVA
jgi:FAD/FMN-containing dehydrogenase